MSQPRIEISLDDQQLTLIRGNHRHQWPVSTSARGSGFTENSHRTPTGRFRICEKIGSGAPPNTIFRARQPAGRWNENASGEDLILARILRLQGLDPGNANTYDRFIYIHGTNDESRLGEPASCGCIRMSRRAIIKLFELTPVGTEVIIHPRTRPRGKIIFFDCDSTLSSIEGIDELARAAGPAVFKQIENLTRAAMNGEVPLDAVFPRRMNLLSPTRTSCEYVARQYLATITPGAPELIRDLHLNGWTTVILSGGFEPLIRPLADHLGIHHVEAVPLHFSPCGNYLGYGIDYPTTRNGGKPDVIREWRDATLPEAIVMLGDGVSDLESKPECDLFIGYGGVIERPAVKQGADQWITDFRTIHAANLDSWLAKDRVKLKTQSIINGLHKSIHMDKPTAAMSSKTETAVKKTNKGKRYSQAEKQEILDLVNTINNTKGRGGQAAASKKYGISPLTISSWVKSGGAPPKKPGRKPGRKAGAKAARKAGKKVASAPTPAPAAAASSGGLEQKLDKLKKLAKLIDTTESELKKLRSEFDKLKGSL